MRHVVESPRIGHHIEECLAMGVTWYVAHDRQCGQSSHPLPTLEAARRWLMPVVL